MTTRAKTLALVAVALVFAGAMGECVVRVLPPAMLPELGPVQPATIDIGKFARASSNPRLVYELAPGSFEINAAGYRGPEYPERKPAGTKRIVGIGDSSAFGSGVGEGDTYLRRLERLLNAGDGDTVQVVNLAVAGYNSHQELEVLRTRGLAFDPDLVVLGYDHNDPAPILGRKRPPMPDDYGKNPLHSELVRYVMRTLYSGPQFRFNRRVDDYVATGANWKSHLEALEEMCRVCNEHGIPGVVVLYDMRIAPGDFESTKHYRRLHAPLLELWETGGFSVLDCCPMLQTHMLSQGWVNIEPLWVSVEPRDGHPNANGHRVIAEALVEVIEGDSLLR